MQNFNCETLMACTLEYNIKISTGKMLFNKVIINLQKLKAHSIENFIALKNSCLQIDGNNLKK